MADLSKQQIIWQVLASIPAGKVTTYGAVARLAGYPNHARYVGSTLKQLPANTRLPWHRVVAAQGRIAFPVASESYAEQVRRLGAEGIEVHHHKVSLSRYGWPNN